MENDKWKMTKTRALLVDDHEIVREGVKRILEDISSEFFIGEASTDAEAVRRLQENEWDLMVLDLSLHGRSGLEVLKSAKQIRPKIRVLVLSMHSEEQYAIRAFKAGASGYITKGSPREELSQAIKKILKGGRYVSPSLAEIMVVGLAQTDEDKPPHQLLSNRELEVLCLIASGKTVGQVAEKLNLSDKTISTYRTRILEKMSMKTNAELTHYAIKNHLV